MAAEIVKAVRIILASGMCRLLAYRRITALSLVVSNLYERAGSIGPNGSGRFRLGKRSPAEIAFG
jgi:hypothetical protein